MTAPSSPRVSVITPFLNAEPFLAEAVDSVLSQTFQDFELLLVDDGSTDGGSQMALDYARAHPGRVRYLEHPGHANRGISASRNLGLAQARGEFIAFIDADDLWRPAKLAEQLAILAAHPEVAMVCGAVNYWRSWNGGSDTLVPTGPVVDGIMAPPATSLAIYPLGRASAPCPSDVLLRRTAIEAVGGSEEHFRGPYNFYEDQGLFAKIYLAYPVYFSSRVWLDYRQHEESCVSVTLRENGYRMVRSYFLRWLAGRVGRENLPVRRRIRMELFRLKHQRLARLADRVFALWGRLRGAV